MVMFCSLLFLNVQGVMANSGPPIIGITVRPSTCQEDFLEEDYVSSFPGNFDILVKESDFTEEDFGPMTDTFKSFYPFYEDIQYLDNIEEGWVSFSAFYQEENAFGYADYQCGMQFGNSTLVTQTSAIKLIYFSDQGDTLYVSEEIRVPSVYFYQDRDAVISFDTDTYQVNPSLEPYTNPYLFLMVIVVVGFMAFSIVIEVVVASIFKLFTKKALLNVLLINFVTQGILYIYFYLIFDGHRHDYFNHLYMAEILIFLVEFAYLYWRLQKEFTIKRLAFYVLVSNIVSYLLGIVRYY